MPGPLSDFEGERAPTLGVVEAAGLEMSKAKIEKSGYHKTFGPESPQHPQAPVEERVAIRVTMLQDPAVSEVAEDVGAPDSFTFRHQVERRLIPLAGFLDEALRQQDVANVVVRGRDPVLPPQRLGALKSNPSVEQRFLVVFG